MRTGPRRGRARSEGDGDGVGDAVVQVHGLPPSRLILTLPRGRGGSYANTDSHASCSSRGIRRLTSPYHLSESSLPSLLRLPPIAASSSARRLACRSGEARHLTHQRPSDLVPAASVSAHRLISSRQSVVLSDGEHPGSQVGVPTAQAFVKTESSRASNTAGSAMWSSMIVSLKYPGRVAAGLPRARDEVPHVPVGGQQLGEPLGRRASTAPSKRPPGQAGAGPASPTSVQLLGRARGDRRLDVDRAGQVGDAR